MCVSECVWRARKSGGGEWRDKKNNSKGKAGKAGNRVERERERQVEQEAQVAPLPRSTCGARGRKGKLKKTVGGK